MPIDGRVVVITGASEGIGAAFAQACAARGAKVVLAARRREQLDAVAEKCPGALSCVTDVTRRQDVERLLAAAVAHFGHVDAWVNNAGRGITRSTLALTDEDLDEMMRVNVKSALYGMQIAAAHFQARGAGHIVNVSSMLSRAPFAPARSAYSAAKHALNSLTANLRDELRQLAPAVRVSLVIPGVVATSFGLNALGGGIDSRSLPAAQPVGEVAQVMVRLLEDPVDEVYTRPSYHQQVVDYFKSTSR